MERDKMKCDYNSEQYTRNKVHVKIKIVKYKKSERLSKISRNKKTSLTLLKQSSEKWIETIINNLENDNSNKLYQYVKI